MRFAGSPPILQQAAAHGAPDELERFAEYHANFRSKGHSNENAQRFAMEALRSGTAPAQSTRYRLLS